MTSYGDWIRDKTARFQQIQTEGNNKVTQRREHEKRLQSQVRAASIPDEALTEKLMKLIKETQHNTGVHPFAVCAATFSVLAAATQGEFVLRLERHLPPVSLSLWFMVEMKSGGGKSVVVNYMENLLKASLASLEEKQRKLHSDYTTKRTVWESKKKGFESAQRLKIKKGDDSTEIDEQLEIHMRSEPKRPRELIRNCTDITHSGLISIASNELPTLMISSAEGGMVLENVDDKFMYLANSLWSAEDVRHKRGRGESIVIKSARLSMAIFAQPSVYEKFIKLVGEQASGCGHFARYIGFKIDGAGPRVDDDRSEVSVQQGEMFARDMAEIYRLQIKDDWTGLQDPKTIELSAEARLALDEASRQIMSDRANASADELNTEFAAKLPEIIGRFAALMHINDNLASAAEIPISVDTMRIAIRFGMIVAEEHKKFFNDALFLSQTEKDEQLLWKWLSLQRRQTGSDRFVLREVRQACPNALRGNNRLDRALKGLAEKDYVTLPRPTASGRKDVIITKFGLRNLSD